MLLDMKELGGIEVDVSLVMLFYCDDYYNCDEDDSIIGKFIVECNIVKNKDGEIGIIEFEYYKKI